MSLENHMLILDDIQTQVSTTKHPFEYTNRTFEAYLSDEEGIGDGFFEEVRREETGMTRLETMDMGEYIQSSKFFDEQRELEEKRKIQTHRLSLNNKYKHGPLAEECRSAGMGNLR